MFRFQSSIFIKFAIAAAAFISQKACAAIVNFSVALIETDPVFNRPLSISALSAVETQVAYDVYGFHASAKCTYSIKTTAFNSTGGGSTSDYYIAPY